MFFRKDKKTAEQKPLPAWRQWFNALVFAVVVATPFRLFVFEAYAIPTGSMEGTLLIGDRLYVSKMAYGARIPMTPVAIPLVHNEMPVVGGKSYTDAVQWKYRRLPGFGKVERNDIVVFNGPEGDTALKEQPDINYYQACRAMGRDAVLANYTIITHPVDKKENLVKRCVGLPGDVLEMRNAKLFVNGKPEKLHPHAKHHYIVTTNGNRPSVDEDMEMMQPINNNTYLYNLSNEEVAQVRKAPNVVSAKLYTKYAAGISPEAPQEFVFPLDTEHFNWNADNMGPLTVPKAGAAVKLTPQNIALYRRIIANYEGNKLEERAGKISINGKESTSYTFKMDYYWMMGDNRHESLDSRYWGFVPEDHIVGQPTLVWLSFGEGGLTDMRWNRLMRGIGTLEN